MARLRRSKLLTCFYCGKRSSIPNDGSRKEFLCLYCDATNHVDEHGEITDPPVATEREPPAPRYVQNQPSSSPTNPRADSIFCDTCLKNQRLFTASLAQYLPDDPSDPINQPLDRKYYKFRRDLEERYPQVCADCEGRVQGRLQAAGYTAQTDHLRRLMENSRARRPRKKLTLLDVAERVGRMLWWTGLLLQAMWHFKTIAQIMHLYTESHAGMVDPDSSTANSWVGSLIEVSTWLPSPDILIRGSIIAAVASVWWNPRFVQVTRGFSRHLLGFRQWYCFQGLIIFFRVIFRRVGELEADLLGSSASPVMPHMLMAGLMLLITVIARNSIRVDTQALFKVPQGPRSPPRQRVPSGYANSSKQVQPLVRKEEARQAPEPNRRAGPAPVNLQPLPGPQPPPIPFGSSSNQRPSPLSRPAFGAPEPQSPVIDEPEEMDWTPTQSQHRAFSNLPAAGSPSRPFSQAPVQAESGPFWYKVPPAPINPAHKLRNPPRVPIVRNPAIDRKPEGFSVSTTARLQKEIPEARSTAVEFQQPTFFAPTKDDERSSLADMLNKSFSLGNEQDETHAGTTAVPVPAISSEGQPPGSNMHEPVMACLLSAVWAMTMLFPNDRIIPHFKEIRLGAVIVAGGLALARIGQPVDITNRDSGGFGEMMALLSPLVEISELALLCYVGWETWVGQAQITSLGLGVLLFGFVKSAVVVINRRRHLVAP